MEKTLTPADLRQFTGSETWYRHGLVRHILYTDGAQYVAEVGGAYWLLDEIALAQRAVPAVIAQPFQVWTLTLREDQTAELVCGDGNDETVWSKVIAFTDFPLPSITLWFTNNTILLPSEY
jgi:hypothetical protein